MTKKDEFKRLESFITEHREAHYRLAYSYVRNKENALDIIQDSILKALKSIDRLEDVTYLKTWFYRIIVNTSIDFIRKHKRVTVMDDDVLCLHLPQLKDEMTDMDLREAIDQLSSTDKTLIILRFFEDLKIEEIAAITEQNINTVKTKLYRALKKLCIEVGDGHLGIDTGYEVVTDTARILSITRYKVNTAGSSSTTMKYDTIDKQESILITLPILFKDDQYLEVISSYITGEMKRQMTADEGISYFLDDDFASNFEGIKPYQNFYITSNHKLMISFDKYEIAPGSMGVVMFEIPSDILSDLLVSDTYIN